jgi:hypothetical protein
MSLVVTSNIALEDNPEFSNAFKPYSYQNRLLNTMKIPPNSEIALQSAKINKNGLFVLDRSNSGFCHYFGTPVGDGTDEVANIEDSTTVPFRAVIGAGEAFRAGAEKNEVNTDDMANEIQKGINQAVFHPSLITGEATTGVKVDIEYGSGNSFNGFKFVATQHTAKTGRAKADLVYTDVSKNNDYNFGQAAGVVTSTDIDGFYVQNREYPISQNAGECTFNFSDANSGGRWMCGLSRINKPRDIGAGDFDHTPTYFDESLNTTNHMRRTRGQFLYADVCVVREGTNLKIYQSSARTNAGTGHGINMNEVIYYGSHNVNFSDGIYDIGSNLEHYQKLKFTLTNEKLRIDIITGDGGSVLLCDHDTLVAAGATKNEFLNPVNAAKWAMYPVLAASGNSQAGGQALSIDTIQHYSVYPKFDINKYFNYDWWGWSQEYDETIFCKELEMRPFNNYSNAKILTPKGINASGGMEDYDSLIITATSEEYGEESTQDCNTQFTLGFVGTAVSLPTDSTLLTTTNKSSSPLKLVSNVSLFIRLNNFTQNTINARQGTISKIVGHLPRFDNSGNENGGLYFEPHEKTYLSLNNPEPIYINSFDVDVVYENETLCTALQGKTIVCFHIRQAK